MTDLIKRDDDLLWPSAYVGTPEQLLNCLIEMWRREKRVTVSAVLHATIETLRALPATDRIEELVEERDIARRLLGAATQMQKETEAKLTKAVEALLEIITCWDAPSWKDVDQQARAMGNVINRARPVLAERASPISCGTAWRGRDD